MQTPDSHRHAVAVLLAIDASDTEGLELLVSSLDDAERAALIASLGELAYSGVRARVGGAADLAREVLVEFATSIASEG